MPLIVVGADTDTGRAIVEGLTDPAREVRAFVSDEKTASELRSMRVKVALGDVSDDSHVEAASTACFTAVLIAEAAFDNRERSFAKSAEEVFDGWAAAVTASKVKRVLWVTADETPGLAIDEVAMLDPSDPKLVEKVVALDDAQTIGVDPII